MDPNLIKILSETGVAVVLGVSLLYLLKVWIPKQSDQFLAAMEQKRKDDQAAFDRAREDYLEADKERQLNYLTSLMQQRTDFIAATKQIEERHWTHIQALQASFERLLEASQQNCDEKVSSLAKAIQNLGDILITSGVEHQRRGDFGIPPKPEDQRSRDP